MKSIIVILLLIAVGLAIYRVNNPPPIPMYIALSMLDIPAKEIDEANNTVTLQVDSKLGAQNFAPLEFVDRHDISNFVDVARIDDQIAQDLRQCTNELLGRQLSNFVKELRFRSQCLQNLGWNNNDQAYINSKHHL